MNLDVLRRYAAEFLGTFALVFFGCGTRIMVGDTENPAGILVVHLAFGLIIAAMIYTLSISLLLILILQSRSVLPSRAVFPGVTRYHIGWLNLQAQ